MRTRTIITWTIFILIEAMGVLSIWIFATERWRVIPNPPITHVVFGLLLGASIFVALMLLFLAPVLISTSCLIVKRAIDNVHKNDYEKARIFLSRYRLPFCLPSPRCDEIVCILRHLCEDRKRKPEGMSPEFTDCIVPDDFGNYVLNWEGQEKMIKKVNSGWLTADKAENFSSPKTMRILMRLVVVVAIIRGVALIFQLLSRH